ncbi:pilus assembly PilX family protein [Marinagarivorans algicola]|uniref:pilus assembly PilX family protein n=1 Tax=Marinagarivorans algicola TaxID=1513270 RepID=UPI0037355DB2
MNLIKQPYKILSPNIFYMKYQQGAALIISLIILGVLTVIGITSMQNSGLELKMVSSAHDRGVAFEAVETALTTIEKALADNPPKLEKHYTSCTGNDCFSSDCNDGLCFAGNFDAGTERAHCYIANASTNPKKDFWKDETLNVWNVNSKHKKITIDGLKNPVKYIIEFLCFTNVGLELGAGFSTQGASVQASENENYKPLYRITAMASGNANRATVILQTTYRIVKEL